jgi:predicted small lipoprotein YifL
MSASCCRAIGIRARLYSVATLMLVTTAACGVLGPPVPPEDVGINPVIERQLRREGLLAPSQVVRGTASRPSAPGLVTIQENAIPLGDPLPVPPTRSMGTRP